jgi:glycosyltransferase involved in cell wall biosynthesis
MRVLLVTQAFPPFNASGVIRVGHLAAYLLEQGHDVRVLTAAPLPYPRTMATLIPPELVVTTASWDPFAFLAWLRRRRARSNQLPAGPLVGEGWKGGALRAIGSVIAVPEPQIGWYPTAVQGGLHLLRRWCPDAIYASALPFTAHLVAARLARAAAAPWVAEFRDHFAGNPYARLPRWREGIDLRIERHVLRTAAACVAVSEPMVATLKARHAKPALAVLNGFDDQTEVAASYTATASAPLRILYTGVIYPGRRDPGPLFAALQRLGEDRRNIEVVFHGQDLRGVAEAAARYGVADVVHVRGPITYHDSLAQQRQSDVLLLLLCSDPAEAGVYTGKLFEYVGAGRPILAIGAESGVAVDLIRERRLGVATHDTDAIVTALRIWLAEKRGGGSVAPPPMSSRTGLSRREQFTRVDDLLRRLIAQGTAGALTA